MKKIIYIFSVLMLISLTSSGLKAQDQEAMKKWMDYMTPGEEHKAMAKMNGDWKYTSKFWMAPEQEPMTANGTAKCEMLLGGRYMQMKVNGNMMGMPFEGISINGYDNAAKQYQSSWIDNMGTSVMYLTGTASGGVITMTGSMIDPMTSKNMIVRQTLRWDGDKMIMEMYDTKDGVENKTMEITYSKN